MRDGSGDKPSPEEVQKVKSIQGAPDTGSISGISITPNAGEDRSMTGKPQSKPGEKPVAGVGE